MNPFINASNTTFDLIPFLDFFREDCLHFRLACDSTNPTMHLNVSSHSVSFSICLLELHSSFCFTLRRLSRQDFCSCLSSSAHPTRATLKPRDLIRFRD